KVVILALLQPVVDGLPILPQQGVVLGVAPLQTRSDVVVIGPLVLPLQPRRVGGVALSQPGCEVRVPGLQAAQVVGVPLLQLGVVVGVAFLQARVEVVVVSHLDVLIAGCYVLLMDTLVLAKAHPQLIYVRASCLGVSIQKGQTLGIVGESGSGKSVTVNAVMRLLPRNAMLDGASSIELTRKDGSVVDLVQMSNRGEEIRSIRGGEIAMIFQEPMASFSPVYTVGNHMVEAILTHRDMSKREAREYAIDLLDKVGIANPSQRFKQYPFELSGGMRQRAMIAIALSTGPSLLIADEPTTALDVTIQAQILDLMRQLQDEFDMSIIFITHDLGVISQVADEIVVMYLGKVMERGRIREVIRNPQHPYTKSLLRAIPRLDTLGQRLTAIGGKLPSPLERPAGCPFHTRCPEAIVGTCDVRVPAETVVTEGHEASCFLVE
ncbi:MAG: ABC transporter ATP-binding protein, partial [Chloroflexota bacterium]